VRVRAVSCLFFLLFTRSQRIKVFAPLSFPFTTETPPFFHFPANEGVLGDYHRSILSAPPPFGTTPTQAVQTLSSPTPSLSLDPPRSDRSSDLFFFFFLRRQGEIKGGGPFLFFPMKDTPPQTRPSEADTKAAASSTRGRPLPFVSFSLPDFRSSISSSTLRADTKTSFRRSN